MCRRTLSSPELFSRVLRSWSTLGRVFPTGVLCPGGAPIAVRGRWLRRAADPRLRWGGGRSGETRRFASVKASRSSATSSGGGLGEQPVSSCGGVECHGGFYRPSNGLIRSVTLAGDCRPTGLEDSLGCRLLHRLDGLASLMPCLMSRFAHRRSERLCRHVPLTRSVRREDPGQFRSRPSAAHGSPPEFGRRPLNGSGGACVPSRRGGAGQGLRREGGRVRVAQSSQDLTGRSLHT